MHRNNKLKAILKKVSEVIFSEDTSYGELQETLRSWRESLETYHEMDPDTPEYNENVYLDEGKAIATRWAALCIEDLVRTKRFVSAVKKAADSVLRKKPGTPATILYVGTGPFATLVLPLTQVFSPSEIQFDLIEVNNETFKLLKATIQSYGLEAYVRNYYCTDATRFKVENTDVDILLVECLQQALAREPQVKITENLVPQLKDDMILIPEDISLSLALLNTAQQQSFLLNTDPTREIDFYKIIDTVFSINKEVVLKNELSYDEHTVLISEDQLKDRNRISIFTEMTLFEDERLTYNESGLTIPWDITDYSTESQIHGVTLKYVTGSEPGLNIKIKKGPYEKAPKSNI